MLYDPLSVTNEVDNFFDRQSIWYINGHQHCHFSRGWSSSWVKHNLSWAEKNHFEIAFSFVYVIFTGHHFPIGQIFAYSAFWSVWKVEGALCLNNSDFSQILPGLKNVPCCSYSHLPRYPNTWFQLHSNIWFTNYSFSYQIKLMKIYEQQYRKIWMLWLQDYLFRFANVLITVDIKYWSGCNSCVERNLPFPHKMTWLG